MRPAGRVQNQAEGCEERVQESLRFLRGGSGSIGVKPAGVGQGQVRVFVTGGEGQMKFGIRA